MNQVDAALSRIATSVSNAGASFAVVGGLAVSVRAEPRLTRDADLAVAVEGDAEAEELVRDLVAAGYVTQTIVEQESTGRLATARLIHPKDRGLFADLLFASSGIEREIVTAAEVVEITEGISLPVASVGHLIAMKLLARDDRNRPMDADDLRSLARVALEADWLEAEDAVSLIQKRGYARDRNLSLALHELRSR